ncbi:hypothetical protein CVS40_12011 [Lucilia cuprina]|nr:hypothetical protein CVS40_12011 [Lucilia cuprina]
MSYEQISTVLEQHFHPRPNEILEIYRFYLRKQEECESYSEFMVVLKRMGATCIFGIYMEKTLRNQFVFGLKTQLIQSRLLEKADLTLESALNLAEAVEMAEKGGVELNSNTYNALNVVRNFKKKTNKMQEKRKVRPGPH